MNALVLLPVLVPLTAAALGLVAWRSAPAQRLIALARREVTPGRRLPENDRGRHPGPG